MRFAVRPTFQDGDVGIIGTYVLVVAAVVVPADDGMTVGAREVDAVAGLGVEDGIRVSALNMSHCR